MDVFGKLCSEGTDLSYESFYHSNFILPFAVSPEPAYSYSVDLQERISTRPIHGTDKFRLFMKFNRPLE